MNVQEIIEAVAGDGGVSGTPRPTLSWREGVNSNAYYFVDVVTETALAPIYFIGDRASRLGNPVVVARAFETNHVPLLIGIDYAVTSPAPFSVTFPYDGFAAITTNGASSYGVRWPLDFAFSESIEGSSRVYTVSVEPYDPGGVLAWEVGVTLPESLALAAEEQFHSTGVYEGAAESGSEDDVTVYGTFTEYVTVLWGLTP